MLRVGQEMSKTEFRLEEGTGLRSTGSFHRGNGVASAHPEHKVRLGSTFPIGNFEKSLFYLQCYGATVSPLKFSI